MSGPTRRKVFLTRFFGVWDHFELFSLENEQNSIKNERILIENERISIENERVSMKSERISMKNTRITFYECPELLSR